MALSLLPGLLLMFAPARAPFFKYYKRVGPKRGQIVKILKAFSKIGYPPGGKSGGKFQKAGGKRGIMRGFSRTRGQILFPEVVFTANVCCEGLRGLSFAAHVFSPMFPANVS